MARYDNIFEYESDLAGDGLAVGIVMSRFNQDICEGLLAACTAELKRLGVADDDVEIATAVSYTHLTAFTVSIEAASGVTTGISAQDRARTIQVAVARDARPEDIVQPGHIFPITAKAGGVLVRAGHTEAGCDLAQIAGLDPSSVICEILKDDGSMARLDDLITFAQTHSLKIGSIADLINFRSRNETLVERAFSKPVQSVHGEFTLHAYTCLLYTSRCV